MIENFSKLMSNAKLYNQEAQRTPRKINKNKQTYPKYVVVKLQNIKDKGKKIGKKTEEEKNSTFKEAKKCS